MKSAADTSVIVASFASWHEHHAVAAAAIGRIDVVVAHCLLETYSVLTRLPAPHRMTSEVVSTYLRDAFGKSAIAALSAAEQRKLVSTCAEHGLAGGAIYDGVIAMTCVRAGARLLTLDARARQTYTILGLEPELLACSPAALAARSPGHARRVTLAAPSAARSASRSAPRATR